MLLSLVPLTMRQAPCALSRDLVGEHHSRNGSILAETVMVMPLLLLLIFGVIQFSYIWMAREMTAYAAFCATRATMVVRNNEKQFAAENAARVALSWFTLSDDGGGRVDIPGWGQVPGSGKYKGEYRVKTKVLKNGEDEPVAAVRVSFRFPLMIPGMVVNRIIANSVNGNVLGGSDPDFYGALNEAASGQPSVDWPCLDLKETCVLPMPYSTEELPQNGFSGINITGGS